MDTGTSLDIVHEEEHKEEDGNAPSNEAEEMKGSDKEENSTVFEKPKDRDVNLSKDILDISANSSRGYSTFGLNSHSSSQMLTKSVWDLEKSNKKQKRTGIPYLYLYVYLNLSCAKYWYVLSQLGLALKV